MRQRHVFAISAVALLMQITAASAACDPWNDLQSQDFAPRTATVVPPQRLVLLDGAALPLSGGERVIITSGFDSQLACVVRVGPAPTFSFQSGQIATSLLQIDAGSSANWSGSWQSGEEKFLDIDGGGDALYNIAGQASWGMSDPERVARGGVNIGDLSVTVKPKRGRASFTLTHDGEMLAYNPSADYCSVRLWLVGEFLVAVDNYRCGGMNVTFSGFYARSAPGD